MLQFVVNLPGFKTRGPFLSVISTSYWVSFSKVHDFGTSPFLYSWRSSRSTWQSDCMPKSKKKLLRSLHGPKDSAGLLQVE